MSDSDENSGSEAQIGGGRASVESISEFFKEFKSARMSFEPLDTWLFVNAHNIGSTEVESVSDSNDISANSESDSSLVYHFDSDEVSSNDDDDDDVADDTASDAPSACTIYDYDKEDTFIIKNLANSPGQSGCGGVKVFKEMDQYEDDDCAVSDASSDYCFSLRNNTVDSEQPPVSQTAGSRDCGYNKYGVWNECVSENQENVTYRMSKCYRDCDLLEKPESSYKNISKLTVDNSYRSWSHINQNTLTSDSVAGNVYDDSIVECNTCDIDNSRKADVNDTIKRKKKRQRIAQELLDTEATYQQHLELIVQYFEDPLSMSALLPSQAVSAIFGNVREIIGINHELMRHLSTKNIGEAFLLLGPFLKLYSTYANNHEHALASLMDYEQKFPEFASFRRQQEELPVMNGLKLNALLITPVQRIPRYKLLLIDLLKNTLPDDDDYAALTEAVRQVSDVANHINEHIKQQDNFMRMFAIQKSLACPVGPRILVPGRVFIKEGQLKKVSKRSSVGRMDERTFFLFSDILIYAKPRLLDGAASGAVRAWGGVTNRSSSSSPSLVCCCIMPLHHCRVERVFGQSHSTENSAQGTLFSITCKQESVLLFSDQKTVNAWIDALSKAIHDCQLSRQTLRKTSSAKEPMRRRGIARMWKAEKQSDRLLSIVGSPERPRSRTGETPGTPLSPGHLLSRFLFSSGDKDKSPACSSPLKSAKKHPILSCLNSKSHKRQRQVEPLSPDINIMSDGTSSSSPTVHQWPGNL